MGYKEWVKDYPEVHDYMNRAYNHDAIVEFAQKHGIDINSIGAINMITLPYNDKVIEVFGKDQVLPYYKSKCLVAFCIEYRNYDIQYFSIFMEKMLTEEFDKKVYEDLGISRNKDGINCIVVTIHDLINAVNAAGKIIDR